jgi:hypothetical protein
MKTNTRCHHCGIDLSENTIGYLVKDIYFYSIFYDSNDINYVEENIPKINSHSFYCKNCDKDLNLTAEEIIKILE